MKPRRVRGRTFVFFARGEEHVIVTGIAGDPALDWALARMAYLEIISGFSAVSTFTIGSSELSMNPMSSYISPGTVLITSKFFNSYEENGKIYNYDNLRGYRLNRRLVKINDKKSKINNSPS